MSKTVPDIPHVPPTSASPIPIETQEKLLQVVMRRQAALSLRVSAVFLLPLLALPWINQSRPAFMNGHVLGFSVTWLILGICFFPLTWMLSTYFVHRSDRIEAECTLLGREILPAPPVKDVTAVSAQEEGMV